MYKKNLSSSYLAQHFDLDSSLTVYECIRNGAGKILVLLHKYENLSPESNEAHILEDEITKYDGWNIDVRIKRFVTDLNIPPLDKSIGQLSGGERRRVALAKTIIGMPEL